jgi:NAD(P)H-flavin reductase
VPSGSGSDPHLLALLRALRLRAAAPEAAAAGEADVEAAFTTEARSTAEGTGDAAHRGVQAGPAGDEHAALPPGRVLPGLPAAPPPQQLHAATGNADGPDGSGADAEPATPSRPANPDPFAQAPGAPPPSHPTRPVNPFRRTPPEPSRPAAPPAVPPAALPAVPPAALPAVPPAVQPAIPPAIQPAVQPAVPPAVQPGALPAVPPTVVPPAAVPPIEPDTPPAGTPAPPFVPALINPWRPPTPAPTRGTNTTTAPGPGSVNPGALVPRHPSPPPAPPLAPPPAPPPGPPTADPPVPGETPIPWAARTGPVPPAHGGPIPAGPISGGPISVDPVAGVSAIGRPVPGQHPEAPHPGTALTGVPRTGPAHPPGAAPAQPADGMDPADDAELREVQRLLGNSLSLAGGPADVATRLRAALIQAQPQLAALLPGSPLVQRDQLARALTWLVHHLDQPPALVAGCVQLGAALAECGVQPPQLQLAGAALAEAMRAGMAAGGWRQDFDLAWRDTWQHVHEWIGHGATLPRYEPTTWRAAVVAHERRRPDLAVVRFRPYLPMPFRPGQYARIELPARAGVWRPYSLAGDPRHDTVLELHVRAKTETGVSGTLVHHTAVGDEVRFRRPEGEMSVPAARPHRDLLLVAGDTGVAPLKAMLSELAATGDPRSAVLFWGVRDLDELYDIDEITEIARSCRRATVVPVVSEGDCGPYASGLVTDAIAAYGEWSEAEAFLAGPPLMLAATAAALRLLGVPPDRIHHDSADG